jgi:formate dehydrogenase major subunit
MDEPPDAPMPNLSESPAHVSGAPRSTFNRRDLLRLTLGGGSGLALGGLLDVPAMRAATSDMKLADVSEFTTSCNFCSCGCGMIAAVRDGKLLTMEGDYDHIVNRGALCVKGISMFATHTSPKRLTTPRYRAPGSDRWEDISWDDAIARVAQSVRKTRDATWIATEKVDAPELVVDLTAGDRIESAPRVVPQVGSNKNQEVPVNRTDAMGFMGGAQNTNEECYLFQKAARLLGMAYVEHQARL